MAVQLDEYPLVPSMLSGEIVARMGEGRLWIEKAAPWLGETLGLESGTPGPLPVSREVDSPAAGLASLLRQLLTVQPVIHDFCLEVPTPGRGTIWLLADGQTVERDDGRVAVLTLRDVSGLVRQRRQAAAVGAFHGLIGQSLPMLEVYYRISMYGPTDAPVIVTGETGTGKELVARALHERSARAAQPFVPVNCCALTPELFESELFGHEKGSFTGAYRQHRGRFERADKGTLFLDEVGDMPLITQAKMLRALEEGVIERVGGEAEQAVDVRVLAATNAALEYSVSMGRFRADLYHRLSVFRIHLPALRERIDDLPLLADHFIAHFNRRYQRSIKRLTPQALRILQEYPWPGNIRELRNVIERVVVETSGDAIGANTLGRWIAEREYLMPGDWNADSAFARRDPIITQPPGWGGVPPQGWRTPVEQAPLALSSAHVTIDEPAAEPVELTAEAIRAAFRAAHGNVTRAAASLRVHKATLYRHMKRLNLTREELESEVQA
ncbi:sigma-54-dependent Fis family transcriptional regulator [Candidatus Poribacteria bacterium]|nr:sigma-54-dependent Fis family transcriptional regulator [Candidatus Poribacteria bacterium]